MGDTVGPLDAAGVGCGLCTLCNVSEGLASAELVAAAACPLASGTGSAGTRALGGE